MKQYCVERILDEDTVLLENLEDGEKRTYMCVKHSLHEGDIVAETKYGFVYDPDATAARKANIQKKFRDLLNQ